MNARDFALILLDSKRLPGWTANLPRKGRRHEPTDPRDWALAEQIATGIVKNLLLLRHATEHYSGKSLAGIDPIVQKILAIGLYQLKFLDRIPASAAVDQAVEQTKTFGRRRASGFVNAVLRNVERMPAPTIPDMIADPEGYAECALSHPRPLFRRLVKLLDAEKAIAFCQHDNAKPPTILRLFPGIEPKDLIAELKRDGDPSPIELLPHESPNMVIVAHGARLISAFTEWARLGLAQVQDPTAARVVDKMKLSPGMRVLDRCAGLGTKTIQITEQIGRTGQLIAMDSSQIRCDTLRRLATERRLTNVQVFHAAKLASAHDIPADFDRILIDAPCSNSGVLARRPEARYRDQVDCLAKLQREILDDTIPRLAHGGILVYSTCSVWPDENELQVRGFLSRHPDLELLEESTTWPSFNETAAEKYHDGGYFAVMCRTRKPEARNQNGESNQKPE